MSKVESFLFKVLLVFTLPLVFVALAGFTSTTSTVTQAKQIQKLPTVVIVGKKTAPKVAEQGNASLEVASR